MSQDDIESRADCIQRTAKYLKKFQKQLDLVRCIGGCGVELELLHNDKETKDKLFAAVKQILTASQDIEKALQETKLI